VRIFNSITTKIIFVFIIITINLFLTIGSFFVFQPVAENSHELSLYINDLENEMDTMFNSIYQVSYLLKKYPEMPTDVRNELNEGMKSDIQEVREYVVESPDTYTADIMNEIATISGAMDTLDFERINRFRNVDDFLPNIANIIGVNNHIQMEREISRIQEYISELRPDLVYIYKLDSTDIAKYSETIDKMYRYKSKIDSSFNDIKVLMSNEVERVRHKQESMIHGIILITCISFVVLIWIIVFSILMPFRKIKKNLKEMSRGNLNVEFNRRRNDEIKEIYDSFNDFLTSINTIFDLEDRVLEENDLDETILYMYNNFQEFIPFYKISITFEDKYGNMNMIKVKDGSVIRKIIPEGVFRHYHEITTKGKFVIVPLETDQVYLGNMYFHFRTTECITPTVINFIDMIQNKLSMAFYKNIFIKNIFSIITDTLAEVTEHKDTDTGNHIFRMSEYAKLIAKDLHERGMYPEVIDNHFIENIKITASMHDIGKVSIPDNILNKPGKLTDNEFDVMKSHSEVGGVILDHLDNQLKKYNINYFEMASEIATHHHEKYNGRGYPEGLSDVEIPLSARIIAVADVFDALLSKRVYKEGFSFEKSLSIIQEDSGTHFDPEIVKSFMNVKDKIYDIYVEYS
jgi:HD-GYP domain-containing protein (c-di-GMP phosphodiesterase class II)